MEARQPSMQQADPNDKSQARQRPLRIFCKQDPELNIAVRGDDVILVRADPNDKSQHWFQEYDAVGKLTDDEGRRPFALVNRTTGQAMVNRDNAVRLAPYSPHVGVELSMLWSLGKELACGFVEVRTLKDLSTTINGLKGYVKPGTLIGMYGSSPTYANAVWKFEPIPDQSSIDTPAV